MERTVVAVEPTDNQTQVNGLTKPLIACALVAGFGMGMSVLMPRWVEGKLALWACMLLALVVALVAVGVFAAVTWLLCKVKLRKPAHANQAFAHGRRFVGICFLVLMASFTFSLLSVYPGYAGNDSMDIIRQATGEYQHTDSFRYDGLSNHHPILYTLLVRGVFAVTALFGAGLQASTFCFLLLQAALFAAACAWALGWCNRHGSGRACLVAVLVVLAVVPVYAVHAVTLWKDGLFAVSMLMTSMLAFEVAMAERRPWRLLLAFGASCLVTALLRNNGIFIDAAVLLWMLVVVPEARKAVFACGVCVAVAFAGVQCVYTAVLHAESGHFSESVGIPIQQIALVVKDDALNENQEEFVSQILPLQNWKDDYETFESNGIKFDPAFNDEFLEANKVEFLATWAGVVVQHPATAVRAWWQVVGGFMTPGQYAAIGTKGTVAGGKITDLPGTGWNPRDAFNKVQKKLPYVLGKGTMIWLGLWLSLLAIALHPRRRGAGATAFIPMLALLATMLIASPSGWDYRYVLPFVVMLSFVPFFIGDALRRRTECNAQAIPLVESEEVKTVLG